MEKAPFVDTTEGRSMFRLLTLRLGYVNLRVGMTPTSLFSM
jgi:hypothetical protein